MRERNERLKETEMVQKKEHLLCGGGISCIPTVLLYRVLVSRAMSYGTDGDRIAQ